MRTPPYIIYNIDYTLFSRKSKEKTRGVNLLEKKGYIHIDRETGNLSFTDAGRKKAEGIYERHQTLTKALMKLGAKPGLAEENACRMEHVVSDEMMEVFRNYIKE